MRSVIKLLGLTAAFVAGSAHAVVVTEAGDAGELLASAQVINGAVNTINGTLTNLGTRTAPVDDIDMYRLFISDTSAFGVTVSVTGSDDSDGRLYLFDSLGHLVAWNDDISVDNLLPQFNPGVISGLSAGNYFLAFNLYETAPVFTGGVLTGWDRYPLPFQTGSYTLNITGANGAPTTGAVPEPATWLSMILGMGAVGFGLRRRRQTVRVNFAA